MSYEIVKSIKIEDGVVFIKSASNNVFPKKFDWWESHILGSILEEKGRASLDKEILFQYYNGKFQESDNKYEKSIFFKKSKEHNWSDKLSDEEIKDELYESFLKFKKRIKGQFIIKNTPTGGYVFGKTSNSIQLSPLNISAKIFKSREDALYYMRYGDMRKYKIIKIEV